MNMINRGYGYVWNIVYRIIKAIKCKKKVAKV